MEKLKMHSPNITQDNVIRIQELFPNCVTESQGAEGRVKLAVDFDQLRQELAESIVDGPQERYHLNWPGKREALLTANAPIAKTLRPCRKESVDFDITKNIFIEGDNLDALKLLQETYLGKVKMIYIDPPYNTGSDFIYCDNFAINAETYKVQSNQEDEAGNHLVANTEANGRFHSAWLSMIYGRLRLARNLLRDDGVIFISIDDYESSSLKKLCDEIFGPQNFLCSLIWNKQHSQQQGLFKKYHEYVLLYAKNASAHSNISGGDGVIDAGALKKISKANPSSEFTFPAGVRFDAADGFELTGTFGDSEQVTVLSGRFLAKNGVTTEAVTLSAGWTQKEQMKAYFEGKAVIDTKGQKVLEFYFSSSGKLKCRKERSKITPPTLLPPYGMVSEQTAYLASLFGKPVFDNPKPVQMIRDFVSWFVREDDIVLDFFAGSATTCEAVLAEAPSARYIAIQLPAEVDASSEAGKAALSLGLKTICDIGKERIRRVGQQLRVADASSDSESLKIDVGFRVLKIDTSNMADVYYAPDALDNTKFELFVDNIKPDRTPEDLLFQVMLDWGIDLALPITKQAIQGKDVFFVDGNALAACFDASGSIDEAFVKELAKQQPLRVVFRDAGYKDSAVKINVEQVFKLLSPATEVKCI
jgi:adenine-specific DNA-methyltransferase